VSPRTWSAAIASSPAGVAEGGPIEEAARAALDGKLVVVPTDTVYGIGTRPDDPDATARLVEAKRRPEHLELPVLVASLEAAERIGVIDDRARALTRELWPGALTVVIPRRKESSRWALGGNERTIGVRMPGHPVALALLRRAGALAVTSANISGQPTPTTCEALHSVFGATVEIYLCEKEALTGRASTVVDVSGTVITILREGEIPASIVFDVLERDAT
jgi:L-threonylcarbamoyladenylate synthase